MSNPRKSIEDHKLTGSHVTRALKRGPAPRLAKRADLEALFAELTQRRAEALADVRKNGMVLLQDKFSARGELYQTRVVNPALRIAQDCERQLASLAKLLVGDADDSMKFAFDRELDAIMGSQRADA